MIEGFDPDKFRQVNQQQQQSVKVAGNSSRGGGNRQTAEKIDHQLIPGAVPTYDMSEKQLLASLEQELGVLWFDSELLYSGVQVVKRTLTVFMLKCPGDWPPLRWRHLIWLGAQGYPQRCKSGWTSAHLWCHTAWKRFFKMKGREKKIEIYFDDDMCQLLNVVTI